jgi:hypothetical protein
MEPRTFRNRTYPVMGWIFGTPACLVAVGLIVAAFVGTNVTGAERAVLFVASAATAGVTWFVFRTYALSRIVATGSGVIIVNPIRTTAIPWRDIEKFEAAGMLRVCKTDGSSVSVFAVQTANAARMAGRTSHADHVAGDLNRLLVESRGQPWTDEAAHFHRSPAERRQLRRRGVAIAAFAAVAVGVRMAIR